MLIAEFPAICKQWLIKDYNPLIAIQLVKGLMG